MSLLWFNLSTSSEGGSAGILLMWLLSRSSIFRRVRLYKAEGSGRDGRDESKQTKKKKKSVILCLETPSKSPNHGCQKYTPYKRISDLRIPSMSSIMWYFEALTTAPRRHGWQASSAGGALGCCAAANPSLLCHYQDYSRKSSGGRNSTLKIISSYILFFFPKSLAATAFQPVVRHSVDWSESGGGLGAVRPCVGPCGPLEGRPAFILRQD